MKKDLIESCCTIANAARDLASNASRVYFKHVSATCRPPLPAASAQGQSRAPPLAKGGTARVVRVDAWHSKYIFLTIKKVSILWHLPLDWRTCSLGLGLMDILELTHNGKVSKHEEMFYLNDYIIWLYLFMPVSLFPHEDYQIKILFHHNWWSFGSLLVTSYHCPDFATLANSIQCKSSEYVLVFINKWMFKFFYVGR